MSTTDERTISSSLPRRRPSNPIRWTLLTIGVAIIVLLGVVFGLQLDRGGQITESPLVGKPAPDFDLPGLDGGRVRLADFVGRPVVINFWASWCVPCREEAPRLESFYQRYGAQGVGVIGIVWNDSASAAKRFRAEFGLTFPQATDPGLGAALEYGVRGVPETYVISANGIIMAKVIGAVGPTTLDDILVDVLSGRPRTERNEQDYRTDPPG